MVLRVAIRDTVEGQPFEGKTAYFALSDCLGSGFRPLFANEISYARFHAGKLDDIWNYWHTSMSMVVSGTTRRNEDVEIYVHSPHALCDIDNLGLAYAEGIKHDSVPFPEDEFYRLLEVADGKAVSVLDRQKKRFVEHVPLESALEDETLVAALGGRTSAKNYVRRFGKLYKTDKIRVKIDCAFDKKPLAKFIVMGGDDIGIQTNPMYMMARLACIPERADLNLEHVLRMAEDRDFVKNGDVEEFRTYLEQLRQ